MPFLMKASVTIRREIEDTFYFVFRLMVYCCHLIMPATPSKTIQTTFALTPKEFRAEIKSLLFYICNIWSQSYDF
jgi:hypothetical protein